MIRPLRRPPERHRTVGSTSGTIGGSNVGAGGREALSLSHSALSLSQSARPSVEAVATSPSPLIRHPPMTPSTLAVWGLVAAGGLEPFGGHLDPIKDSQALRATPDQRHKPDYRENEDDDENQEACADRTEDHDAPPFLQRPGRTPEGEYPARREPNVDSLRPTRFDTSHRGYSSRERPNDRTVRIAGAAKERT